MSAEPAPSQTKNWFESLWIDLLAFLAGLAMAWFLNWQTRDLVWSLWLSSLVLGYTTILLLIFVPLVRATEPRHPIAFVFQFLGCLFLVAFFTVHFGMFHIGHSFFLNTFFPIVAIGKSEIPPLAMYGTIVLSYWPFVLAAAIAERQNLRTALTPPPKGQKPNMFLPYKNVIRMHLLIFFFAGVAYSGLESFPVYAAVYFLYFFPWVRIFGALFKRKRNS